MHSPIPQIVEWQLDFVLLFESRHNTREMKAWNGKNIFSWFSSIPLGHFVSFKEFDPLKGSFKFSTVCLSLSKSFFMSSLTALFFFSSRRIDQKKNLLLEMAQTSKSFPSSKITNFQRDVCCIVTENIWSKSLYLLPSWTLDRILVWFSNWLFVVHKSWIGNENRYVIYLLGSYKRVIKREVVYKGTNKDYLSEEKPSKSKMHCPQAQQVQARHLLGRLNCRALNKQTPCALYRFSHSCRYSIFFTMLWKNEWT